MNGRISLSWGFGVANPQDRRSPPVHDERQDKFILRISLSWGFGVPNPRIGEVLPFTMNGRISLSWGFGVPNPQDRRSPPIHDERQDKFILGVRGSEPPGSGVHDERA